MSLKSLGNEHEVFTFHPRGARLFPDRNESLALQW